VHEEREQVVNARGESSRRFLSFFFSFFEISALGKNDLSRPRNKKTRGFSASSRAPPPPPPPPAAPRDYFTIREEERKALSFHVYKKRQSFLKKLKEDPTLLSFLLLSPFYFFLCAGALKLAWPVAPLPATSTLTS